MIVTALKSSTPCHSFSIAFENCVCFLAKRDGSMIPRRHSVDWVKFYTQRARFGRRDRHVSGSSLSPAWKFRLASLAFSIVIVLSPFCRNPSSSGRAASSCDNFPKVFPRSCWRSAVLQLKCRLQQLHSSSKVRTDLSPRRNGKVQCVDWFLLVSAPFPAVPPSTPFLLNRRNQYINWSFQIEKSWLCTELDRGDRVFQWFCEESSRNKRIGKYVCWNNWEQMNSLFKRNN